MITTNRLRASRANAGRSTGPRTREGKCASAANSLKAGLFAQQFVIAALGESVETWEAFRDGIVRELDARGALEVELAGRVAHLSWRARRVGAYEAAAASAAPLPPHPDGVPPAVGEQFLPLPPTAATAEKLARVRATLPAARNAAAVRRSALAVAGRVDRPDCVGALDAAPVLSFLDAVGDALGWDRYAEPSPWSAVLRDLGLKRTSIYKVAWTAALLKSAVGRAAATSGRATDDVLEQATDALRSASEAAVENVRCWGAEEAALIDALLEERSAAAARNLFADDAVVQRVARAESHLSRELDRALAALERVRGMRAERTTEPVSPTEVGSFCRTGCSNWRGGAPALRPARCGGPAAEVAPTTRTGALMPGRTSHSPPRSSTTG